MEIKEMKEMKNKDQKYTAKQLQSLQENYLDMFIKGKMSMNEYLKNMATICDRADQLRFMSSGESVPELSRSEL